MTSASGEEEGCRDMTIETVAQGSTREPELRGQTVVVIGGSAGIGLETARRVRAEGADVILTARDSIACTASASSSGLPASRPSTPPTSND